MAPAVEVSGCSKWYGQVLGISDVTWSADGGIIGLLGPNGAGKSTLMKLLAGLLRPSRGACRVHGRNTFAVPAARTRLGYCPEHDGVYDDLSALEFVAAMAQLSGMSRADATPAAKRALAAMGMTYAQDRRLRGFSKGMRQRTKLAQTIVHDPDVILLDEPLTGVDPVARRQIIDAVRSMGDGGKTVIVSSHVLHEIQALTDEILVIYRGQILAEGNVFAIRGLIDKHPHRIRVECDEPRRIAAGVAGADHVARLTFEDRAVVIETRDPDKCYDLISRVVMDEDLPIQALTSPDNNLGAVFDYLTGRNEGAAE